MNVNGNCRLTVLFSTDVNEQYKHDYNSYNALTRSLIFQLFIPIAIHTVTHTEKHEKTRYIDPFLSLLLISRQPAVSPSQISAAGGGARPSAGKDATMHPCDLVSQGPLSLLTASASN
jgi:hypothetical protein